MHDLLTVSVGKDSCWFCVLHFFSFENKHELKTYLFQNKMDSIQNNLKLEIKEETEEEKIDIENHFHPAISSCEEDQLTRSVC
jgi:hypothetical protein